MGKALKAKDLQPRPQLAVYGGRQSCKNVR